MLYNPLFLLFILMFKLSSTSSRKPLQAGYCIVLKCPQHSLSTFLLYGIKICSRLILLFLRRRLWEIFLTLLLWCRIQDHHLDYKLSLTAGTLTPYRLPSHIRLSSPLSNFQYPEPKACLYSLPHPYFLPPARIPPCLGRFPSRGYNQPTHSSFNTCHQISLP